MTTLSAKKAVLNSLLFVKDAAGKNIPEIDGIGGVWTIPSCVAVSCLPDADGETEVIIGPAGEAGTHKKLLFDGILETPSRAIAVETVLVETLLEVQVSSDKTHIQIWTNGNRDSDIVIIGIVK